MRLSLQTWVWNLTPLWLGTLLANLTGKVWVQVTDCETNKVTGYRWDDISYHRR